MLRSWLNALQLYAVVYALRLPLGFWGKSCLYPQHGGLAAPWFCIICGSVALLSVAGLHPLETGWQQQQLPTCADSETSACPLDVFAWMLGTEGSDRGVLSRPSPADPVVARACRTNAN